MRTKNDDQSVNEPRPSAGRDTKVTDLT